MAEFVMHHLCRENGVAERFEIASAAVSTEEIGNDIYPPAKRTLNAHQIPFKHRAARRITRADLDYYDHIICADRSNIRLMQYHLGDAMNNSHAKISQLMQWTGQSRDVSDPWYTGDFETAYNDIDTACRAILQTLTTDNLAE